MIDVGIVMPVYKQKPEYLKEALESMLNQSHTEFRLVIVIDGDPAMTPLVQQLAGADPRVQILVNEQNMGVASALNRGFEEVIFRDEALQYVTWVSSDNVYHPQFISVLRGALARGPEELGLVYSSFRSIDGEGRPLEGEKELALLRQYQSQPKEALLEACITGVSFMYKAKYAKQIEGYHMEPVEDYEYWLRLTELCEMRYVPVELIDYRVNSEFSISATLKAPENHRRWRHAFLLARHQARARRGIPPEVAVIACVKDSTEETIAWLETLYEQSYSNYTVHILNLSADRLAAQDLALIHHPTAAIQWFPGLKPSAAILGTLQVIHTPFTYVLGPGGFGGQLQLEVLVQQMRTAPPELLSNYYNSHNLVGYRSFHGEVKSYENELFRTEKLQQLLTEKLTAGSDA